MKYLFKLYHWRENAIQLVLQRCSIQCLYCTGPARICSHNSDGWIGLRRVLAEPSVVTGKREAPVEAPIGGMYSTVASVTQAQAASGANTMPTGAHT